MDCGLSERAARVLKTLVECYIRDGHPVGSRTIRESSGLGLSAASIRNVMAQLEDRGFLFSPHTSAGRVPTARGYRFFVDTLLRAQPASPGDLSRVQEMLRPERDAMELLQAASGLVSSITSQAGVVTLPRPGGRQLRKVEFLPLAAHRVLVILVVNEREVQHHIIETRRPFSEAELAAAAAHVNGRFSGYTLDDVQAALATELCEAQSRIDGAMAAMLELAAQALEREEHGQDPLIVAGESHLLDSVSAEQLDALRGLFEALERKKDLLHLLERCSEARGIQIFIGGEAGDGLPGDYSLVTAPYGHPLRPLGVLGVLGPTRMAYDRVIPVVEMTSRVLSAALTH